MTRKTPTTRLRTLVLAGACTALGACGTPPTESADAVHARQQVGVITVPFSVVDLDQEGIEGIFAGIEQDLTDMGLEPVEDGSGDGWRTWRVDLAAAARSAPDSGMPAVAEDERIPVWLRYEVDPSGRITASSHVRAGERAIDDPEWSQLISGLPLGSLWHGKR